MLAEFLRMVHRLKLQVEKGEDALGIRESVGHRVCWNSDAWAEARIGHALKPAIDETPLEFWHVFHYPGALLDACFRKRYRG